MSFLLVASRVNSTWRTISQPLLFKLAPVTPSTVDAFLLQLEPKGLVDATHLVRLTDDDGRKGEDVDQWELPPIIRKLLTHLSHLERVEFVGCQPMWNLWPAIPN